MEKTYIVLLRIKKRGSSDYVKLTRQDAEELSWETIKVKDERDIHSFLFDKLSKGGHVKINKRHISVFDQDDFMDSWNDTDDDGKYLDVMKHWIGFIKVELG